MFVGSSLRKLYNQTYEIAQTIASYSPFRLVEKIKISSANILSSTPSEPFIPTSERELKRFAASLVLSQEFPSKNIELYSCSDAEYLFLDGIAGPLAQGDLKTVRFCLEDLQEMARTNYRALELYPQVVRLLLKKAQEEKNEELYTIAHSHFSKLTPDSYARIARSYEKNLKINIDSTPAAKIAAEAKYHQTKELNVDERTMKIAACALAAFSLVLPFMPAIVAAIPKGPCKPLPHDQVPPVLGSGPSAAMIVRSDLDPNKPDEALCLLGIDPVRAQTLHPYARQRQLQSKVGLVQTLHPKYNPQEGEPLFSKAFRTLSRAYNNAERDLRVELIEAAISGK